MCLAARILAALQRENTAVGSSEEGLLDDFWLAFSGSSAVSGGKNHDSQLYGFKLFKNTWRKKKKKHSTKMENTILNLDKQNSFTNHLIDIFIFHLLYIIYTFLS